jgi:hypothetical protein
MKQRQQVESGAGTSSFRIFFLIWFGQLISQLGSGLTGFALGVWVYQQTNSVTQLTLISFFGGLAFVVFSPIAGVLVDRWDRRMALIVSEAGATLLPLGLALLIAIGYTPIWAVYLIVAVSALFRSFQFPAFAAATTLIVPKAQLGRASGLVQLALGVSQLLSPVLAGVLMGLIYLEGVFIVDIVTFVISIATLMLVRIPRPTPSATAGAERGSLLTELSFGWRYIVARPGLLGLLLFFAASNFLMSTVVVLSTPLILSFASPAVLGTVLSVAGCGLLLGSTVMSIWGGPKRRVYGVFGAMALSALSIIVAGLTLSAWLIGAAAFFFSAGLPILAASSQAIWQRKIPADIQGRVFATRTMIAQGSMPLAYLVSGPLVDRVFTPLLVEGGPLAGSVGRVIGVGPVRGIGLLFIIMGLLSLVSIVLGYLYPPLRRVEEDLPDAIPDQPPAMPEGEQDLSVAVPRLEQI